MRYWSQGGKVPGSCPELEIKPVRPPPAPPDLSDQWNFTSECFKSSATNPIRALECTPIYFSPEWSKETKEPASQSAF